MESEPYVIIFLLVGLILLLVSGKYLVESSANLARHFRIPAGIIGLTVVAFGTSAPELLVSIQAAVQGHPEMAIGNVMGSNISNILLVLALTTIIFPLWVQRSAIVRDWPVMMFISLVLGLFLLDLRLSRFEGGLLLILLAFYILISIRISRKEGKAEKAEKRDESLMKWWLAAIMLLLSCVGLAGGAHLLVKNASLIATNLGISERVISISMVALGTSLPELTTSLIAAFKKETEISIGNIIGSNIMNVISVLGITSIIKPFNVVRETLTIDMPWMLGSAVLLLLFMLPARKGRINRLEGSLLLLAYAFYISFIFMK